MNRSKIILVDQEEEYVYPLMFRILSSLSEEQVELEIYTKQDVFENAVRQNLKGDILLISEKLYITDYQNYFKQIVILTETYQNNVDVTKKCLQIYRFSKISAIINLIIKCMPQDDCTIKQKQPVIITVTSVAGGTGKTVTALSFVKCMNEFGKKALYVDMEDIQEFNSYLKSDDILDKSVLRKLGNMEIDSGYFCEKENICYLPQGEVPMLSLNKTIEEYIGFLEKLVACGSYQYIVVDTNTSFDKYKLQLFQLSEFVMFVLEPQDSVIEKFKIFNRFMKLDNKKCFTLCNKTHGNTNVGSKYGGIIFDGIIPEFRELESLELIRQISKLSSIKETVYQVL